MKLIFQIALGVFAGMLGSQLVIDAWHAHRERAVAEVESARREKDALQYQQQAEKLRALLSTQLQQHAGQQGLLDAPGMAPDADVGDSNVPVDAAAPHP